MQWTDACGSELAEIKKFEPRICRALILGDDKALVMKQYRRHYLTYWLQFPIIAIFGGHVIMKIPKICFYFTTPRKKSKVWKAPLSQFLDT